MLETIEDVREYVREVLDGFRQDPPNSDHQKGYLAAFEEAATLLGLDKE